MSDLERPGDGAFAFCAVPAGAWAEPATSFNIGSDSQRPFAIVIVGGMLMPMLLGFFIYPVFYQLFARDGDTLKV